MIRSWLSARCVAMAVRLICWAERIIGANDVTLRVYKKSQEGWMMDLTVKGPYGIETTRVGEIR